jgi:hypothetical protein
MAERADLIECKIVDMYDGRLFVDDFEQVTVVGRPHV